MIYNLLIVNDKLSMINYQWQLNGVVISTIVTISHKKKYFFNRWQGYFYIFFIMGKFLNFFMDVPIINLAHKILIGKKEIATVNFGKL